MRPDNSPDASGGPTAPVSGGTVLGLDNVRLELPIAGIGSRILAAFIDYVLLFFLQVVWLFGSLTFFGVADLGGWGIGVVVLGFFVLLWGYFAVCEIAMDGKTPGKLVVGLRTVASHGGRATTAAFIARNFLRLLDNFLGLPIMAVDRRSRRLGDAVAGTLVVHDRDPPEEVQLGRHPPSWSSREVAVVESFLRRVRWMERERAQELGGRLLRWIERQEPAFWNEHAAISEAYEGGDQVALLRQALAVR